MDPEHCEFLAEDVMIQIVPRRNEPVLHLVCGDIGPFEAGIPVEAPLWLAVDLRRKHYCEIVPPSWFNLDELKRLVAIEGETEGLSRLPLFIFEIANILVRAAKEDITDGDQIKVLIQDLWDKREAKLRTSSLKLLSQHTHAHVRLDSVQPLEVTSIRPNLSACKQIARLVRNSHSVQPD
ncbi:partner of SLD five, PSF2 [Necator americanus]|uniref:DNA replication complex GINS protein PSF2 n=1 Tax=Necator americanus TaxID=51031 RepID=W2SU55_NECAM|nr:partner of SLD five, PSF2 [Necator americanus]ETN72361.1 partner of SLD five, PSF2 [Necator americanus]